MIDLATIQPEIENFDQTEVKNCPIPIEIYAAEAVQYVNRAQNDMTQLQTINFSEVTLERAYFLGHHLIDLIGQIKGTDTDKETLMATWETEYHDAQEFCADMLDLFDYTFLDNESVQERISLVREGDSIIDTISDLKALAVIATEHPTELEAVNFDVSKITEAEALADRLLDLRGQIDGAMYIQSQAIITRNIVYSLLKKEVDKICAAGRYIHRKDQQKRLGYGSRYRRNKKAEQQRQQALLETEE